MENHLWKLLELFPNKPWSWMDIIANPNTSWDMLNYIVMTGDLPDPWKKSNQMWMAEANNNITWDIIEQKSDDHWSWDILSENTCVTPDIVTDHPDKPWDWRALSGNPNMTLETLKTVGHNSRMKWDWLGLSSHPRVTFDIVMANRDANWDWEALSMNPNITIDIIMSNKNLPWKWYYVSMNPNITVDDIINTPNIYWIPTNIISNEHIPIEDLPRIICSKVLKANAKHITRRKDVTWNFIKNMDWIDVDWWYVSKNDNIEWKHISENHRPWDWNNVSRNPNITWSIVVDNMNNPWDWGELGANEFNQAAHVRKGEMNTLNCLVFDETPLFVPADVIGEWINML